MKAILFGLAALFVLADCDNHLFRQADTDRDNHLTEAEFDTIFDHWDTNHDSRVDQFEFTTGWERDDWDDVDSVVLEFHLFDSNDDGAITDVPDLRHLFKTFDGNGNSEISASEFRLAWDALLDD